MCSSAHSKTLRAHNWPASRALLGGRRRRSRRGWSRHGQPGVDLVENSGQQRLRRGLDDCPKYLGINNFQRRTHWRGGFLRREKGDAPGTRHAHSGRSPDSVVPESPDVGSRVPHQLSARRPRRLRRRRRRPPQRGAPGSPPLLAYRALPVVAVIPVPVVDVAPARVPSLTWTPVIARRRGRGRLGRRGETGRQAESGHSHPATHQHVR
jgi:hypothetical protein